MKQLNMDLKLKGKVAIVTGASKGIGAGIAKALAAEGVLVAVNYASSREGADRVVQAITSQGGQAIAIKGNVGNSEDVKELFETTKRALGVPEIVVNNAGVFKFEPVEAVTEEEFKHEFTTNVWGPILTTQQALQYFPATGGSIINISSGASTHPMANASLYGATKGALDTLTKALARELAGKKIRVNVVSPGATETEGAHRLGFIGSDLERLFVDKTPLGRLGQPEDVAKAVVFLASDAAAWVTGVILSASGGLDI